MELTQTKLFETSPLTLTQTTIFDQPQKEIQPAFEISAETNKRWKLEATEGHYKALLAKLGNGADWEYRGECTEDPRCGGRCSCGHIGLRYLFTIRHKETGRPAIVGSTCIGHFRSVNEKMVAGIEADREKMEQAEKNRLKAAKENARDAEIQTLTAELHRVTWELEEKIAATYRPGAKIWEQRKVKYHLWQHCLTPGYCFDRVNSYDTRTDPNPRIRVKQYKSKPAFIRNLKKRIEDTKVDLENPWQ